MSINVPPHFERVAGLTGRVRNFLVPKTFCGLNDSRNNAGQ